MDFIRLRQEYHKRVCSEIIWLKKDGNEVYPNFADKGSKASREIAVCILEKIGFVPGDYRISSQASGRLFERITKDYLEKAFTLLSHLRPGKWQYATNMPISAFDQYQHLANLEKIVKGDNELASALGKDYIITPDIVIGRWPVSDEEINQKGSSISGDIVARYTHFRSANLPQSQIQPLLHASISCKWTLRSDRGQNSRTESLNLIRNRKGHTPHIVAVTAEPLPTRLASLALGTGDLDCVYHFALHELQESISEIENEDQMDMLMILIKGHRLRDISDLPFDLAA